MKLKLWGLAIACVLTACVGVPNESYWAVHDAAPIEGHKSERMIVEVSDRGPVFHAEQFRRLQQWMESDPDDMPVVVFVNGWHHNAQPSDSNLKDFGNFLGMVETAAGSPVRGLYVGWRGDSVDTVIPWEPSDFLTVWSRKRASVRVGEDGLKQVIDYVRASHPDRKVYFVGHSFGGSALFHAVKHDLPNEANDGFEYIMLNPAVAEREFDEVEQALMNTQAMRLRAANASSMQAQLALERSYRKLTVLQALGDKAVGFAYRVAFLATPVGFDKSRRTHNAYVCNSGQDCPVNGDPECFSTLASGRFVIQTKPQGGKSCGEVNASPVWVITGEDSVSANHNDILSSIQAAALADLIARRIQLAAPSR